MHFPTAWPVKGPEAMCRSAATSAYDRYRHAFESEPDLNWSNDSSAHNRNGMDLTVCQFGIELKPGWMFRF